MSDLEPAARRGIGSWFLLGVFILMLAAWIEYAWELLTVPGGLRNLSSIEFWAPLSFVVIPLLLQWQPACRRSAYTYRVKRFSRITAVLISIAIFAAVFGATPSALERIGVFFWRHIFSVAIGGSGVFALIAVMLLWFLTSYFVARLCYWGLRWRVVRSAVPLCPNCLYCLSGIESGVCPECGTPVERAKQTCARVEEASASGAHVPR